MSVDGPSKNPVHGPEHPQSVGFVAPQKAVFFQDGPPMKLASGGTLAPVEIEFETYGVLNAKKDNAVMVCHALTGDAHLAGWNPDPVGPLRSYRQNKPGWWDEVVGPGKPIDTRLFFVVCANVIGSCYGSSGPQSINPETGRPYGLSFPVVTVNDWARLHFMLLDRLGIDSLYAVVGGSVGGQQALEMALSQPERVRRLIVLSAGSRVTAQGLAFNSVARHAIVGDPNFNGGNYYGAAPPLMGLAAARMLAHITYLSEESMGHKFGRRLQDKARPDFTLTGVEFEVESYLKHQGESFVARYDPNSYLYITRAMDYYDAASSVDGDLSSAAALSRADDDLQGGAGRLQRADGDLTRAAALSRADDDLQGGAGRLQRVDGDLTRAAALSRADDDLQGGAGRLQRADGDLTRAAARIKSKTMVVSFSSDWLFPPELCRELASALCRAGRPVTYVEVPSRYGHDAFLVETETTSRLVGSFLRH